MCLTGWLSHLFVWMLCCIKAQNKTNTFIGITLQHGNAMTVVFEFVSLRHTVCMQAAQHSLSYELTVDNENTECFGWA